MTGTIAPTPDTSGRRRFALLIAGAVAVGVVVAIARSRPEITTRMIPNTVSPAPAVDGEAVPPSPVDELLGQLREDLERGEFDAAIVRLQAAQSDPDVSGCDAAGSCERWAALIAAQKEAKLQLQQYLQSRRDRILAAADGAAPTPPERTVLGRLAWAENELMRVAGGKPPTGGADEGDRVADVLAILGALEVEWRKQDWAAKAAVNPDAALPLEPINRARVALGPLTASVLELRRVAEVERAATAEAQIRRIEAVRAGEIPQEAP